MSAKPDREPTLADVLAAVEQVRDGVRDLRAAVERVLSGLDRIEHRAIPPAGNETTKHETIN